MTPALALQVIAALLSDLPEIVQDVENLVAGLVGGNAAATQPLAPQIQAADSTLVSELPKS